jgi:hypothetical protein
MEKVTVDKDKIYIKSFQSSKEIFLYDVSKIDRRVHNNTSNRGNSPILVIDSLKGDENIYIYYEKYKKEDIHRFIEYIITLNPKIKNTFSD